MTISLVTQYGPWTFGAGIAILALTAFFRGWVVAGKSADKTVERTIAQQQQITDLWKAAAQTSAEALRVEQAHMVTLVSELTVALRAFNGGKG